MASSPPYHLRISFVSSCSEPSNTASSVGRNLHPHPSSPVYILDKSKALFYMKFCFHGGRSEHGECLLFRDEGCWIL
ncbi:unnamed protein product [Brassica rapa subsp. trilocularis]